MGEIFHFHEICQSLRSGQELAVATIVSDAGSTPRSSGSKMIVYPDGGISGTIGGGAVEGDVIQRALRLFKTGGAEIASYDLSQNGRAEQMDLRCGGRMKVLIEHAAVNDENINLYGSANEELKMSRPFWFIGIITDVDGRLQVEHAIQKAEKGLAGLQHFEPEIQKRMESDIHRFNGPRFIEFDETAYLVEFIKPAETLFLFGAGHVAKEIAALSKRVGFRIIVFDDRVEFANADSFPDADGIFVSPEFAEVFKECHVTSDDFIVIVTRGHQFDQKVLVQALQTEAGYIGMIGSRRKKEAIYKELIHQGVTQSVLEQVCCPVGLSIDAETPAEIAVSVVAQMIRQRAKRRNHEND